MKKSRPGPIIKTDANYTYYTILLESLVIRVIRAYNEENGSKARSLNKFKPNILSLNYSATGAGVSVAGASVAGADSAGAVASV